MSMKTRMLIFRIEWHWFLIVKGRRMVAHLCRNHTMLHNRRVQQIFAKLDKHCDKVNVLTRRYERLTGLQEFEILYFNRPAA